METPNIEELTERTPQNIFLIAETLQKTYEEFVRTFQHFQNPKIRDWVNHKMEQEDLLYKDPLVELNFQFEKGKSLKDMVKEGTLHDTVASELYGHISPYMHQSQAIERVLKDQKNVIVSTGTGSGKSLCYWIPILHTCLEIKQQGHDGIKAIVIFPMNALANSQYNSLVETLKDRTGLKVGRYTGDTAYSREEGEKTLEERADREPYDCEYLSRQEIQENPPDVLITNYVMLDLILMRHEDKKLFPERHKKYLKYLVLDEIHTYNGNKGSDVAALIRRLKEKTHTAGSLRCIGTSATIQDDKKESESEDSSSIVEFAEKIFGEPFDNSSLITSSPVKSEPTYSSIKRLPEEIQITPKDLLDFDGTLDTTLPLAKKLLEDPKEVEGVNEKQLGKTLEHQQTVLFLQDQLESGAISLQELAKEYKNAHRNKNTEEECLREMKAALLVGTVARITKNEQERPLIVPKLHLFLTRGHDIHSPLANSGPHLTIDGETVCKVTGFKTFPMYFCRNCGHEFYSVIVSEEHKVYPKNLEEEQPGELFYLTPITEENEDWELPEPWVNNKTYEGVEPKESWYCPDHNTLDSTCRCPSCVKVWKIRYPLLICPSCNVFYTRRKGEYSKLFTFNSTGRSSTTDILSERLLSSLSKDQKKLIVFTDNRQDTALQAEHMNEFRRRGNFRQTMLGLLRKIRDESMRVSDKEIGDELYTYLEENDALPDYSIEEEDEFSTADSNGNVSFTLRQN